MPSEQPTRRYALTEKDAQIAFETQEVHFMNDDRFDGVAEEITKTVGIVFGVIAVVAFTVSAVGAVFCYFAGSH